jgi:hypothetical protein
MGASTNILIISLTISLALSLANPSSWGSPLASFIVTLNSETGEVSISGFQSQIIALVSIAGAIGIFAGLFKSDATYGLFATFLIFMIGFAVVPINFFVSNEIPFFVKTMVGIPLAFMYLLGLVGFFRGADL